MNKEQLQQKLNKTKDQFVVDIFNLTQRAMNNVFEIQNEVKELDKEIDKKIDEEIKIPIKKGEK